MIKGARPILRKSSVFAAFFCPKSVLFKDDEDEFTVVMQDDNDDDEDDEDDEDATSFTSCFQPAGQRHMPSKRASKGWIGEGKIEDGSVRRPWI